jgi:thiol-disulfide isomerase/thioredoxin
VRRLSRRTALASSALLALVASGCTDVAGTDGQTWITGEGRIDQVAIGERGDPVSAVGEDLAGNALDLEDYRGKVVVLNVFASWCGPCRKETPLVVELAAGADPEQVAYLGINIRDDNAAASAFANNFGVEFPSFYDPSSSVLLRLSDELGPYSLPSTAVLDREGRLAALVLGEIPGRATFQQVVDEVVAEGA